MAYSVEDLQQQILRYRDLFLTPEEFKRSLVKLLSNTPPEVVKEWACSPSD